MDARMANALCVKRRVTGPAGAPALRMTGALAWNQIDGTLYGGKGADGSDTATRMVALSGPGGVVDPSTTQTIGGANTISEDILKRTEAVRVRIGRSRRRS